MPTPITKTPIDREMLDLYSDYLISSFSYTTATGFSAMLDHAVSHDKVTRFLAAREYSSQDLWQLVKPMVRKIETDNGAISFDDTIQEKAYTDENDIVAWHFDHSKGRHVKGINILNCTYHNESGTVPLSFDIVKKDVEIVDPKTNKKKRTTSVTKNELFRAQLKICLQNKLKFSYVLADIWFSSKENMGAVAATDRHFIFAIKSNRLVARSRDDARSGRFKQIGSLQLEEHKAVRCCLKGFEAPVLLIKQVFTNKDGSTGVLYLVTSDVSLDASAVATLYHKRWGVEEYHKSIKSNTGLGKSPTQTVITQGNHIFASIYAYFKLELLRMKTAVNHFALKSKLYVKALMVSFKELQKLRREHLSEVGA